MFYISTGIIPRIIGRDWILPKYSGFSDEIDHVNRFMSTARHFDRAFLNELSREDWQGVITSLQKSITDEVIHESVKKFPDTVYQQIGERIEHNLKARRNILMQEGMKYYAFVSKTVDIPGSDRKDFLDVKTLPNGDADVTLRKIKKDGSRGDTIYHRLIIGDQTKEVRLYGQGGEDVFKVEGVYAPGFKLRMIGGEAIDSFYVANSIHARGKLLAYDRSDKPNYYQKHKMRLMTSKNEGVNQYDTRDFHYNRLIGLGSLGFNLDDGLVLGGGVQYTQYGFRRQPFAFRHRLVLGRALATQASFLKYRGEITNVIGKVGLDMFVNVLAPANTSNFFGIGNETAYEKISDPQIRYYRTRYNFTDAQVRLKLALSKSFNIFGGLAGQYFNMNPFDNEGRFINVFVNQENDPSLFNRKTFVGGVIGYEVDTRDNLLVPIRGVHWQTTFTGMRQVDDKDQTFGQVRTDMSFYLSFQRYPRVVFANRIVAGFSVGDPQFFQLFYMGGDGGLLGYRKNRYAGNSMVYENFEVRLKLFDFKSHLFPGTLGLIGYNDVGKVWAPRENSNVWHWGFGGGIYIIPAQSIVVSGVVGSSEEGAFLPYVNMGFRF